MRIVCSIAAVVSIAIAAQGALAQTYIVQRVPSAPPQGVQAIRLSKETMAGQKIRLWSAVLLNPDCTPSGTITSSVIDSPRHGQLDIVDAPTFPNYLPPNPRVACDRKAVPGKQVFYTPAADFHGRDRMVFQNATSDGYVRRFTVDVRVE